MHIKLKRLKENYGNLEEDINFILFERNWEGTTLYEAYVSGEFDDENYDSPFDKLVDEVCDILERNSDVYDVPEEFSTMEEESRWFKKVRHLVANAVNFR